MVHCPGGMACTTVAKQTYALPSRPDLSGGMGSASSAPEAMQPQGDVRAISNSTLQSEDNAGAPVQSSGFLGAPTTPPQAYWKAVNRRQRHSPQLQRPLARQSVRRQLPYRHACRRFRQRQLRRQWVR